MITKFIEPWVLVPGIVIVLLVLLALLMEHTRRRLRRWGRPPLGVRSASLILAATAMLLYLASIDVVGGRLAARWERRIPPASTEELRSAEAVVVLGGGVVASSPAEAALARLDGATAVDTADGNGALAPEAESRLVYGVRLARRLGVPLVTTGGRVLSAETVPPEGEVAARIAADLDTGGAPVERETASRTTAENATAVATAYPYRRVALVTSAYHMPRALLAFTAAGFQPVPAPAAYRRDTRPVRPVMFMPDAATLLHSTTVARELIGLLWYRLTVARISR